MPENRTTRKRCARCGWVGDARARQVRCRQPRFGRGSYACWGELRPVVRPARPADVQVPTPPGLGIGWQVGEEAEMLRNQARRAAAAKLRDAAQKKVEAWTFQVQYAAKKLVEWQRKANRHAREANLTDAEMAARSEAGRKANAAKAEPKIRRSLRVQALDVLRDRQPL